MVDVAGQSGTALLRTFKAIQEERVQTYHLFDDGYKEYLKGSPNYDLNMYKHICNEIGKAFAAQSQHVNKVEEALRVAKYTEAADIIRGIQKLEQKKIHVTSTMQMEGQTFLDNDDVDSATLDNLRKEERSIVEGINDKIEELRYCDVGADEPDTSCDP